MIETLILAAGIPSAAVGFCFWFLERKLEARAAAEKEERQRRQKEFDAREKKQEQLQLVVINSVNACMSLSEATAKAVQRIPDAHCNGDMHDALDYAQQVKHKQKEFLAQQGIHAMI